MTALRRTLGAASFLLAGWAILWAATGDDFAPVRAGLYVAPFLMAMAAMAALAGAALGTRPAAATAALVTVLIAAALPPSFTRIAPATAQRGITLTTLSNRTLNADMAATAAVLRRNPADILVLQEIADPARLTALLSGLYGAGRPPACAGGTYLVVSRFPIGPPRRLRGNAALTCRVELPGGPVAVYSVHLPRALNGHRRQRDAARTLARHAARQPVPVILAGDFNATPLASTLSLAGPGLVNAFDRAGTGPGFTFPTPARAIGALGPFLRIDHVLVSPVLTPVAARAARWHPPGADHYPVEVTITDTRAGG